MKFEPETYSSRKSAFSKYQFDLNLINLITKYQLNQFKVNVLRYIGTSQLICYANQLTGFDVMLKSALIP